MDENDLEKLRQIRSMQNMSLKPSPYLSDTYVDEYGETHSLEVRNYQRIGIMNMCMMPQTILGDACGLGKTLQMLSAIGYVWVQEPEYVPIIITKKSALYQWSDEISKFMKNMQCVTVDRTPTHRQKSYEEFFQNYDSMSKRLLIITYDMLLKDTDESVVRDLSRKPNKREKDVLSGLRNREKLAKRHYEAELKVFGSYFDQRSYEVWDYAHSMSAMGADPTSFEKPTTWCETDEIRTRSLLKLRDEYLEAKKDHESYKSKVSPMMVIPGIIDHMQELKVRHPGIKFMLVMDEAHVLKNHKGKMHGNAARMSKMCDRVYGMTATPVKNRLMEFFSLFRIVVPSLFPQITAFQNEFCVTKLQSIGGGRKVRIVVGYRNLEEFVKRVEPFYLARQKHEVAKELPTLITRELRCELSDEQEELYDLAEAGLLEQSDDPDADSAAVLGAMTHVQEAVNSPELLSDENDDPFEGPSTKLQIFMDMLENDLSNTKVILFSRFRRMIDIIEREVKAAKIKCVRITGAETKAASREQAKKKFQDPKSGINLILITMAGSESINLQTAEHFVMYDAPWSFGDYAQLLGRMIRIGSQHEATVATHLVGVRQDGSKTIDHYVIQKLREKKKLSDKVAGDGLKDGLVFTRDDPMELVDMIKRDQRPSKETKKTLTSQGSKKAVKSEKAKKRPKKAKKKASESVSSKDEEKAVSTPSIDMTDL